MKNKLLLSALCIALLASCTTSKLSHAPEASARDMRIFEKAMTKK